MLAELQGEREKRIAAKSHEGERERRGGQYEGLTRKQKLWNSVDSNTGKILVWKFISHKDSCSPNCFGILKTFSIHPVWVHEEPAELVVAPFLSLLEFVQRIIFLH